MTLRRPHRVSRVLQTLLRMQGGLCGIMGLELSAQSVADPTHELTFSLPAQIRDRDCGLHSQAGPACASHTASPSPTRTSSQPCRVRSGRKAAREECSTSA